MRMLSDSAAGCSKKKKKKKKKAGAHLNSHRRPANYMSALEISGYFSNQMQQQAARRRTHNNGRRCQLVCQRWRSQGTLAWALKQSKCIGQATVGS
jgi:hypothetical protein